MPIEQTEQPATEQPTTTQRIYLFPDQNNNPIYLVRYRLDQLKHDKNCEQVELTLGVPPRHIFDALSLIDQLNLFNATKDSTVIASGYCDPLSFLILQAGKARFAHAHTYFDIHPFVTASGQNVRANQMQIASEEVIKLEDMAIRFGLRRANDLSDSRVLYERIKAKGLLTVSEMQDLGLIDKII